MWLFTVPLYFWHFKNFRHKKFQLYIQHVCCACLYNLTLIHVKIISTSILLNSNVCYYNIELNSFCNSVSRLLVGTVGCSLYNASQIQQLEIAYWPVEFMAKCDTVYYCVFFHVSNWVSICITSKQTRRIKVKFLKPFSGKH